MGCQESLYISLRHGLRQGDPLSPVIFIIIMEVLHRLFSHAANSGKLAPLARHGLHQRMSIFMDDVMIFINPREAELCTCALILDDFGMASGLRVNHQKSSARPIRCTEDQVILTERLLGCSIGTFPCK